MLRSSWHKAVTVSLLLHCLLLSGIGWKPTSNTVTPKEEQNIEMELVPDTSGIDVVSTVASEAVVAESVSEEETKTDSKKEIPEQQTHMENERDVPPAKNGSSVKDTPALMLSDYSQDQLDVALAKYNLIMTVDLSIAILYSDRGKIYYDKGEFDKAFADFNKALVLDPHLSSAHIGRGFIYTKRNQWDLALDDFNQAIAASPKSPLAYYGRAQCFIKNDKKKAIKDFQTFIQYSTPEYKKLTQIVHQMLSELEGK